MRASHALFALSLIVNPLGTNAQGIVQFCDRLISAPEYMADAKFEVLLPSHEEPVTYRLTLQSEARADSLAPCDYVIRWDTDSPSGQVTGFSAYFDGNHYRYRNNRLQEYHMAANSTVFTPNGKADADFATGVQNQAQFADLLPQYIGHRLKQFITDTCYRYAFHADTIVQGRHATVIDGVKRTGGYDAQYFTYVFDCKTGLPMYTDILTGPGSISEQVITVKYMPQASQAALEYTEDALIEQWPEVFERYRESTFGAESLVGNYLPDFSCQIVGSTDRMTHMRGEALGNPTVFVALNPEVSSTQATIEAVREARDILPSNIDIIYAFNTNHTAEIEEIIASPIAGEKTLSSASSLLRNCGINMFPTIIFASSDGKVQDVSLGFNNSLSSIVIEKAMTLK